MSYVLHPVSPGIPGMTDGHLQVAPDKETDMYENPSENSPSLLGVSGAETLTDEMNKVKDDVKEEGVKRYTAAREKLREQWAIAKDDLDNLKQKAMDYSQSAAKATNTFAHDHPWTTASAAVGVGAVIGWLVTRRTSDTHHHAS